MIVKRNKKLSEEEREQSKKSLRAIGLIGGGGALGATSSVIGNELIKRPSRKFNNPKFLDSPEDKELKEKLAKWAEKKRGILVYERGGDMKSAGAIPYTIYHEGKKRNHVKVQVGWKNTASVTAHELGHGEYLSDFGKGGKIGKYLHKIALKTDKLPDSSIAQFGHFANGLHSGYVKEKNKDKGKKTNIITKYKSVVAPIMLSAPNLAAEALASRKGIKLLKKHGASKKYIKDAQKHLGQAYRTYLYNHSQPLMSSVGGELMGRGMRKVENLLQEQNKESTVDNYDSEKE